MSCSKSPARARCRLAASLASRTRRAASARATLSQTGMTWVYFGVAALLPRLPPAGQSARHERRALLRQACGRLAPRWRRRSNVKSNIAPRIFEIN